MLVDVAYMSDQANVTHFLLNTFFRFNKLIILITTFTST